jgi:hypothetical protein
MSKKEFVFIGMSRERTNFFDFGDFSDMKFQYAKLMASKSIGNLHYISVYSTFLEDMKNWNKDGNILNTVKMMRSELGNLSVCQPGYSGNKVHIMLTDESLFIVENAIRSKWEIISSAIFKTVQNFCPNAIIHYKTTTSIRSQYGSLSWQRLWEATRVGAKIAESLNISIIDSFAMTHPLIMEPDIFPDSVHLYSKHLIGNFVSKTISKMFLLQACTQ